MRPTIDCAVYLLRVKLEMKSILIEYNYDNTSPSWAISLVSLYQLITLFVSIIPTYYYNLI